MKISLTEVSHLPGRERESPVTGWAAWEKNGQVVNATEPRVYRTYKLSGSGPNFGGVLNSRTQGQAFLTTIKAQERRGTPPSKMETVENRVWLFHRWC